MLFLNRAASLVATALTMLGLTALSSATNAAETQTPVSASISTINTPAPVPVPVLVPTLAPDADVSAGDTVAYPTLEAAVRGQTTDGATDEQLRCLASAIYYESKGEPLAGQLAVAQVILNRAAQKRFGTDACSVVKQRGQFSFVRGGVIPAVDASRPAYRTALAVAKVAMAEAWDGPVDGALYFHARRVGSFNRVRVAAIGNHVFYR